MSGSDRTPERKCIRCRQILPADVTFCVGCGCQNEPDAVHGKKLQLQGQAEARIGLAKFFQNLSGHIRWFC